MLRFTLLALTACGSHHKASPPPSPRAGKVLSALLAAADAARTPWRCAAADTPPLPEETLAGWKLSGRIASREGDALTIGVVADAGGAAPRTIAALGRLRAQLDQAAPDLVLSLGGMGTTQAELEASLGTVADHAKWLVVALPGDLESTSAHVAAIAALRKRGANIVDGRVVRWIEQPNITIGTLPGAGAPERLVAGGDGCQWRAEDVAQLYGELTAKPGMRIAASAEAPRTTSRGEPAGELALVPPQPIEIALHGPLQPAPTPVRKGVRDAARAPISPGTADATTRLPGAHKASAGVLAIKGASWSWRPLIDAAK